MNFEKIRSLAPIVDKATYLETPARGLNVKPVVESAINAMKAWQNFDEEITNRKLREKVNSKFAELIKVDVRNVTCTTCTSHGLSIIANSFPWNEGDNLVICETEHPNNFYPWARLKKQGIEIKTAPPKNGFIDIDNIVELVDEKTKIITISLVSFYPGAYLDIKKLRNSLVYEDIIIVLDVIQALGFLAIYPQELEVDAISSASYKGLMSPHGGGVLYVNDKLLDLLSPNEVTMLNVANRTTVPVLDYTLIDSADKLQPMPINISQLAAMDAALDIILELGIENIEKYLKNLSSKFVGKLSEAGINTKIPINDPRLKHIVCFDEVDAKSLAEYAKSKKLYLSPRREGIRMGLHIYNNMEDINRAVKIISDFYKQS